jgi:hypothetical protein
MRLMTSADFDRIGRLERQVAYLLRHLGIDPDAAAGQPAGSAFGSPADIFSEVPGGSAGFAAAPAAAGPGMVSGAPAAPAGGYPPEFLDAIQRGKLINAIKIYRQLTGGSLIEAKSAVERIARGEQP